MPKDITSRHTHKPKLSKMVKNYLCQSQPVKIGKGDPLLEGTDTNVKNQGSGKYDITKGNQYSSNN